MTMTLTMTVKTSGHLVLDFAYLAAHPARDKTRVRLATVDGVDVSDLAGESGSELILKPKQTT